MTIVTSETDTRNAQWAKDKSGFGHRMLSKMGWSEGQGLGKNNQGAASHLRGIRRKEVELGIGAQTTDQLTSSGWSETRTNYQSVLSNLKATHGGAATSRPSKKKKKDKKRKLSKRKVRESTPSVSLTLAQNKVTSGYASKMRSAKDLSTKSSQDMAAIFGMKIEDVEQTSLILNSSQPASFGKIEPILPSSSQNKNKRKSSERFVRDGIIKDSSGRKKANKNTKKRIRFEENYGGDDDNNNKNGCGTSERLESESRKAKKSKKKKRRNNEE